MQLNQKSADIISQDSIRERSKLWGSLFSPSVYQQQPFDYRLLNTGKQHQDYMMSVQNVRLYSCKMILSSQAVLSIEFKSEYMLLKR